MTENHFFLENSSGCRLFCIQYFPATAIKQGIVLCHPFGEEKLWAQRVFVTFARFLVRHGYCVLRVDYMGHGDSEGDFGDATLGSHLGDIRSALNYLKTDLVPGTPMGLIGLRLGATLAAIVAETRSDVDQLVLWEPIINGNDYLRQMLRMNIAAQLAAYNQVVHNSEALIQKLKDHERINIEGYEIGHDFYNQLIEVDLLNIKKNYSGEAFVVSIHKNGKRPNQQFERLAGSYAQGSYSIVDQNPFWKAIPTYCKTADLLFEKTLQWLEGSNEYNTGYNSK